MSKRVRVIRILEYEFKDLETYNEHRARCCHEIITSDRQDSMRMKSVFLPVEAIEWDKD